MLGVKKTENPTSPFSAAQNVDRKAQLDHFVADIAAAIHPSQALIAPPTFLSKTGPELITLKVGEPLAAGVVRDILLRLETLKMISKDTFVSLQAFFQSDVPLSDWHAVNAATYSLGEATASSIFARALGTKQRRAFWRGFASALTFGAVVGDGELPKVARLEFKANPGVRDVFLSALRADGELGNPERR